MKRPNVDRDFANFLEQVNRMNDRQKMLPLYPRTKGNPIASHLAAQILDKLGADPAIPDLPHEILETLSRGLVDSNPLRWLEAVENVYATAYHACQTLLCATRDEAEIIRVTGQL